MKTLTKRITKFKRLLTVKYYKLSAIFQRIYYKHTQKLGVHMHYVFNMTSSVYLCFNEIIRINGKMIFIYSTLKVETA